MKSVFVLCIAFAIAFNPAQGLFLDTITGAVSSVSNTIQNGVNNVINTATNTIDSIQSSLNTASIIGQILWDNAFGPAWDLFLNNGADYIDTHFGSILNAIGKKRAVEVRLQWNLVHSVFQQEAQQLITKFKSLLNEFVAEALQIATNSIIPIVFGQTTINDVFGVVLGKFKTYIQQAVQHAVSTFSSALNGLGPEAQQIASVVQTQLQGAGTLFQNELNAISSFAINTVNQALAFFYNNFEDLIDYFKSQVDKLLVDINKILAASVIGLLFGITTPETILTSAVAKLKEYVVETIQYTITYASQKLLALYVQFKPLIDQALSFAQQFNLGAINLSQLQNVVQQIGQQLLAGSGILLPPFINPSLLG